MYCRECARVPTVVMGLVLRFVRAGFFGRELWIQTVGESRWLRSIAMCPQGRATAQSGRDPRR